MRFRQFKLRHRYGMKFIYWSKSARYDGGVTQDTKEWDYTTNSNKTDFKLELIYED